ncbi:MAG: adenosylcobinamide-GDP ribazoletransferase [Dehalococcoidia bacterium]
MKWLQLPLAALEFLTPFRLRRVAEQDPAAIGPSSAFFPLIGLLLGLALIGLDRLLSQALPPPAVDALLVTALALFSGALHLDGLADTADGIFGGRTAERRLEIMRDSRTGSFGALAVGLMLLLQWNALISLSPPWRFGGLLLFPALGRCAAVVALAAFPYARPEGLGTLFHRHAWPWPALFAVLSSLLLSIVLFNGSGAALWGASILLALLLGAAMASRLGGLTGDTYGAICEITQVTVLLLVVSGHQLSWLRPWFFKG